MPQPAELPRWADNQTDPEADLTEPTESVKDDGWLNDEKPPAGYFNWWQNLVYQWTQYLQGIEAEDLDWTGDHTFSEPVAFADDITVGGDATVTGAVEGASLETAQTSVRRAAGWMNVGIASFQPTNTRDATFIDSAFHRLEVPSGTGAGAPYATAPLPFLVVGDRIRDIELTAEPVDGTNDSCDLWLRRINLATGTISDLLLASVTVSTLDTVVSADISHVVADGYEYFLDLEMSAATDGGNVYGVRVRVDRAA